MSPSPETPPIPTRFQHPVAGQYKKWSNENGKKYFSVASGGGTGRTLHPDNMAAGPASYGMTDYDGKNAFGRAVRRFFLRSRARGNDGIDRHGQQSDGRRFRRGCGRGGRGNGEIINTNNCFRRSTRTKCCGCEFLLPAAFVVLSQIND